MTQEKFIGIIPARHESSRFPGKPLADILGRPMFWHVYQQALKCRLLDSVYLATDHSSIYNAACHLQVPVLMTSQEHASGTDRVLEAARQIHAEHDSVIVNIQGDEPALNPGMLHQLLKPFQSNTDINVSTLARPALCGDLKDANTVKVVFSESGKALYFSRSMIPYAKNDFTCYIHIGIYAFRMKYLEKFASLGQSRLEKTEKLEQLRLLEADIPVQVVITDFISHGVDTPSDLEYVKKIIMENNNESYFSP
ncbi:MAG: 3-deoxy-manno-octulosonate cytidylyltransferase [Desulfonatronovibrionaceae bacterium]